MICATLIGYKSIIHTYISSLYYRLFDNQPSIIGARKTITQCSNNYLHVYNCFSKAFRISKPPNRRIYNYLFLTTNEKFHHSFVVWKQSSATTFHIDLPSTIFKFTPNHSHILLILITHQFTRHRNLNNHHHSQEQSILRF